MLKIKYILALCFCVITTNLWALNNLTLTEKNIAKIMPIGEKLTYAIRWTGIPAGKTVIVNKGIVDVKGHKCFHIVSRTKSNSFVSTFYKVNDTIETWIDVKTMASRRFKKKLWEGSHHRDIYVEFDYDKMIATQYSRTPTGAYGKDLDIKLDAYMQDPLSALFYFRKCKNLKKNDNIIIDVNADEKNWKLLVEVKNKDSVKLWGMRKFWTYEVSPVASFEGLFIRKGEMRIWVDENWCIPLRIKVDVPIGAIAVTLEKAEHTNLFSR